ncbi:hypothetical protein SAY86_013345 [Trapa natans]|uniref:DM2 domain-containing protein n=1 Tax=Trapa natans TaxID=22666 RepID=A0AAN7MFQ5_TRANT|nr:hypothetical protein SAY86_013345 [Trapa natans]
MAISLGTLTAPFSTEGPLSLSRVTLPYAAPPPLRLVVPHESKRLSIVRAVTVGAASSEKQPSGIMKPRPVSPEMQDIVGVREIARTQALKQIWAYIKENNLQDPQNKKVIICDEKLKKIFGGKDQVGFLEIAGLISPHFL